MPEIYDKTIMYDPDCNENTGCINNDPEKFKFCPDCGKENNRLRDSVSLKSGFDIPELTGQVPANRTRIDFGYFHTFPIFTPDKRDVEILFVCSPLFANVFLVFIALLSSPASLPSSRFSTLRLEFALLPTLLQIQSLAAPPPPSSSWRSTWLLQRGSEQCQQPLERITCFS